MLPKLTNSRESSRQLLYAFLRCFAAAGRSILIADYFTSCRDARYYRFLPLSCRCAAPCLSSFISTPSLKRVSTGDGAPQLVRAFIG